MLFIFYTLLLFFLVLSVALYHVLVYSNRADKIATGPKVIPPVQFLLHLWVAFKQFYGQFAFQNSHHLRYRQLWWNRQDKMNVVNLYTHFLNFTFLPFKKQLYIFFYQLFDFPSQDSKTLFWNLDNLIFRLIGNIREFYVLAHSTNIGIADRTLPPPKEVGF